MRTTRTIWIAAIGFGTLALTSCGNKDEEAAKALCECMDTEAAGESESASELMAVTDKMGECVKSWQEEYKGQVTKDGFKEELKKECEDVHDMLDDMGAFDKM